MSNCPVCNRPYIERTEGKNKDRPGAQPQEWYKHSEEKWCTRRIPRSAP